VSRFAKWTLLLLVAVSALVAVYLLRLRNVPPRSLSPWFYHRTGDHHPLVMAHQGGEGERPSNTMLAFLNAAKEGADVLDTDMHITKDGVLVLMHDATVDRTTNGHGEIRNLLFSDLRKLNAGYSFTADGGRTFPYRSQTVRVPSVEELFQQFPTRRLGIEIKDADPVEARQFCYLIRKYKMEDHVLVSSFAQANMDVFRSTCPEVATSATAGEVRYFLTLQYLHLTRTLSPAYGSFQVPEAALGRNVITPDFLKAARERNLPVLPWTINEEEDLRRVMDMGVYAINTDYPSRLLRILKEKQ
jgi:glycerophosphoryl diester phosphodiesterase